MLVLSLPLLGILDAEACAENLSDSLEWHSLAFWVEEEDEQPAEEANSAVESKGTAWCQSFHHGQERGRDDDVGTPACDSVLGGLLVISVPYQKAGQTYKHRSNGSYFQRNKFSADPCNGRNSS
jgi:hypothetical protein